MKKRKKNSGKFCQFCLILSKSPGAKQVLSPSGGLVDSFWWDTWGGALHIMLVHNGKLTICFHVKNKQHVNRRKTTTKQTYKHGFRINYAFDKKTQRLFADNCTFFSANNNKNRISVRFENAFPIWEPHFLMQNQNRTEAIKAPKSDYRLNWCKFNKLFSML